MKSTLTAFVIFLAAASAGPSGAPPAAKFEPPEGRVFHGMGQWVEDNRAYLDMLGDVGLFPLTELCFFDLEPTRPWEMTLDNVRAYLTRQKRTGRLPNVNLGMSGPDKETVAWWLPGNSAPFGVDDRVARTTEYDGRIRDVADMLRAHGTPVFLRIGGEFNGPWNGHHPYDYPRAFRKIVNIFRERGAENSAFIWCYEPSAADDFDASDAAGNAKWFPGDDVIDWYGLDVFARRDFSAAFPEFDRRGITPRGKSERFLRLAAEHGRPVMIAESSVVDWDVAAPSVWEEWFEPYFDFVRGHPCVKAFVYVNAEWPRYRPDDPFHWMDGRITENPGAAALYVQELGDGIYLHAGEAAVLEGFDDWLSVPHPPPDFSAAGAYRRDLSDRLDVHVLRWAADPRDGQVSAYRLYEIRDGEPVLVVQTDGLARLFVHVRSGENGPCHYSLTAVDALGREGLASLATCR